jgi:hypothetical protein
MCADEPNRRAAHQRSMVSAVVAQKLGVQGLQKNKRFQARGEALLPKAAPLSSAPAVRAGSMRANHASVLQVPMFIFCVCLDWSAPSVLPEIYGCSADIQSGSTGSSNT